MSPSPLLSVTTRRRRLGHRGQTLAEVAIVLPLLLTLCIGTLQLGFVLYQGHVVRKVAREAANLLSRQANFDATAAAIQTSLPHLGGFDPNAKLILSVVQLGVGGANAGQPIIAQRLEVGSLGGNSIIGNPPSTAFGSGPNYPALDPNNNTSLLTGTLPNGLTVTAGDAIFVAELYINRRDIAQIAWPFAIAFDDHLYANAIF